jgi:serine O-acetyltransferase
VFTAYGLSPTADDPLSVALHRLIGETADQSKLIEAILATLSAKGIEVKCDKHAEQPFDPEQLNKLVD